MTERPIRDQRERQQIHVRLETNMLVEAGAGSGKTTELLHRLVALISSGTAEVSEIAAVTFTRKAAAELRERFQTRLETSLAEARSSGEDPEATARLATALHDIDRGFIGTIHSFCARLLRERPLEAGLDPAFREVFGPEEERLRRQAWGRHLERLTTGGDPSLAELEAVHLEVSRLFDAYEAVVGQPDVTFASAPLEPPQVGGLRDELAAIVDDAWALMPERAPDKGWGGLQNKLRRLRATRWNDGWSDDAVFFDALEIVVGHNLTPTYVRWGPHGDAIRPIHQRLVELAAPGAPAALALRRWQAHRYDVAIRFAERAARAYEEERRRAGLATFNDLLIDAARLLRGSASARRDLAGRYRYLLVDEFQDTDPIQAEIVFLLAAEDPTEDDWHRAVPRPGALFVVGDPKQSIYRFRRADIGIYNQVKARIAACGEVITLTTNFRSQPPIETLVNEVFEGMFPAVATPHQAGFAPLNVRNPDQEQQGVYWYEVASPTRGSAAVAAADAPLVASWIKQRLDDGDRTAGDFMVLTYRKDALSAYGAELEKRGVPFQITGSGVDIAEELQELLVILQALADPEDPVLTCAALLGLFFGLDLEQLAAHRLEPPAENLGGRAFDFTHPHYEDPGPTASAVELDLAQLREWWKTSKALPADVVVGTIAAELGLLPFLAAGDAGGSSAGALSYVLNAVRRAGVDGDTSLQAALEALEEALRAEDVEAPLQPGRDDVVRVMNLHKAKGLEAKVVVLAHPAGHSRHDIDFVVQRPERGDPRGALVIQQSSGSYSKTRLAAPEDWDELVAVEQPFDDAEDARLLYVATTRAEEELVIAFCAASEASSPWRPLYSHRESACERLELEVIEPSERTPLQVPAADIRAEIEALRQERLRRAAPSYEITSVTRAVKRDASIFKIDRGGLGRAWGNAVHQALEAASRGVDETGARAVCRAALLENDLPVDASGEPADLDELVALVEGVRASETWARAQAAAQRLVEAPFASQERSDDDRPLIVEGVIDLAFAEPGGWVIADYKTDVVDDPENLAARRRQYRRQVDEYARYFESITGEPVKERQILWLGMGIEAEVWHHERE